MDFIVIKLGYLLREEILNSLLKDLTSDDILKRPQQNINTPSMTTSAMVRKVLA
jgi:hypothetical protein